MSEETYTKDEKTGAWVSKDQLEAKNKLTSINQKWKNENPEAESDDETSNSPNFLKGLGSLMNMKKSDIVTKKDNSDTKKVSTLLEFQVLVTYLSSVNPLSHGNSSMYKKVI